MTLIWRESMSVNNDQIDNDHRYMVCFLNTVELALQEPEKMDVILQALTQLYNYAYEHFMREELIQKKISYPDYDMHRKEHKELLEDFLKLKIKIENQYTKEEIKEKYDEIVKFLRHWLIDHVLKTDMKLKPFLLQYKKNLSV